MMTLGYYNGKFNELDKMKVPFNDRVCFFGDGVYDATYSHNHKIYAIDDHLNRFYNSAKLLDINLPHTKEQMKKLLLRMVKKVETPDLFVYWQATRGTMPRNHSFDKDIVANIWIVLKPGKVKDTSDKLKVITLEDTRFLHCNIKTLNLLPSVMASQKAESIGCQESILHRNGRVTECAHSNVSIIKNGVVYTAPTDNLILPGITRMHMIRVCNEMGIPVSETAFNLTELMDADEIMISSAGQLCLATTHIDGIPVGGKDNVTLKKIQDALMADYIKQVGN